MSFFPQVLARLMPARARVPEIQKGSATGALVAFEQLGQPVWSPRDYAAFAREGFMQNAICYRSVRMIAEAAASIPLLLYESDIEIGDHPLIDLLRRPSLDHTGTDFLEAWYGFLLVAGNAYVEAVPLDGQLRELHVLRPDRMKVIPGPDGWPEGYDYTAGGQSIRFIDDVVPGVRPILHMRMFNPLNDHYGMSPIEAASVAIDIHNTASAWNKALLDNSARPSGALVYGAGNGQMTAEQFARLKSELETSFEGARNAGRPLLLEGGLDWKPLSMSPKDMDFIEAKNSAAREIALALVAAGYPIILSPGFAAKPAAVGRRAALAAWLTAKAHPLTARVMVNRLWQHHFGRGIVATPNDFGVRGEFPTHPELLDWLANEFVDGGWSVKRMQRLMLQSATYQQSTEADKETLAKDPSNHLFGRMNRLRLEGEIIRDSLLAVSGRLKRTVGGPSVLPSADQTRRSIYVFAKRNARFAFLEPFDLPDDNQSCSKRERSTTAPQALTLLNAADAVAAAKALAGRLEREATSRRTGATRVSARAGASAVAGRIGSGAGVSRRVAAG